MRYRIMAFALLGLVGTSAKAVEPPAVVCQLTEDAIKSHNEKMGKPEYGKVALPSPEQRKDQTLCKGQTEALWGFLSVGGNWENFSIGEQTAEEIPPAVEKINQLYAKLPAIKAKVEEIKAARDQFLIEPTPELQAKLIAKIGDPLLGPAAMPAVPANPIQAGTLFEDPAGESGFYNLMKKIAASQIVTILLDPRKKNVFGIVANSNGVVDPSGEGQLFTRTEIRALWMTPEVEDSAFKEKDGAWGREAEITAALYSLGRGADSIGYQLRDLFYQARKALNDVNIKAGATPKLDEKDVAAIADLEKNIKAATLSRYGLDKVFDNTGAAKEGVTPTPEQTAAHQAIANGHINSDKQFEFTPPGKKEPTLVPLTIAEGSQDVDVPMTAEKVAAALIEGNESLAVALAVKAAVVPGDQAPAAGGEENSSGAGMVGAMMGPQGELAEEIADAPSGKRRLAKYEKRLAKAHRKEAAQRSAERHKAQKELARAIKAADKQYASERKFMPAQAEENRQKAYKAAEAAYGVAIVGAGTKKEVRAELKANIAEDREKAQAEYKQLVVAWIPTAKERFAADEAAIAKSYVGDKADRVLLQTPDGGSGTFLDLYFAEEWAEGAAAYEANVEKCSRQIRPDKDKSFEKCFGARLGDWVKEVRKRNKAERGAGQPHGRKAVKAIRAQARQGAAATQAE